VNPAAAKAPDSRSTVAGSKPDITSGVAIGRSIVPSCAPVIAGRPMDCTSAGRLANGARRA
jgi:hypothetical protein